MLVDLVATRLSTEIAALTARVAQAAELSELVKRGQLPQAQASAFVLPLGLRALSEADAAAGAFTQMLAEIIGVLLVVRHQGDATGAKALPTIDELVAACLATMCGWTPEAGGFAFALARGELVSAEAGLVIYQIDFTLQRQLRIFT